MLTEDKAAHWKTLNKRARNRKIIESFKKGV